MNELVAEHMARQPAEYRAAVELDVASMEPRATTAFMEARGVQVPVPMIIATADWRYIGNALKQYRRQPAEPSFSVLGYLNWPEGTTDYQVERARGIVREFIDENEDVPFGYIEHRVPEPISVGGLRRRVNDTLLSFAAVDHPRDMLVVNHDADLVDTSPNHFGDLYRAFTRRKFILSVIPHLRHARTPNLPNMDKLIEWDEETVWETGEYFDLGPGVSARALLAVNSYDPADTMMETHRLIGRIHAAEPRHWAHPGSVGVRSAVLTVSPRRYYHQYYQGRGPLNIWPKNEPLTPHDEYRELSSAQFDNWPDLPGSIRDRMLREYGAAILQRAFEWRVELGLSPEQALEISVAGLEKIRHRIGGPSSMISEPAREMARRNQG